MLDRKWSEARQKRLDAEMVARQDRLDAEQQERHERVMARIRDA